jgi:hypothetical protein
MMDNRCLLTRLHGDLLCIQNFAMIVTFHNKWPVSFRFLILFVLPFTSFPLLETLHMSRYSSYSYLLPQCDGFESLSISQIFSSSFTGNICVVRMQGGFAGLGGADTILGARRIVETRLTLILLMWRIG